MALRGIPLPAALAWALLAVPFWAGGAAGTRGPCQQPQQQPRFRQPPPGSFQWPSYWVPLMVALGGCCGLAWCVLFVAYNVSQRGAKALPQLPSEEGKAPAPALGDQKDVVKTLFQEDSDTLRGASWPENQAASERIASHSLLEKNVTTDRTGTSPQLDNQAAGGPTWGRSQLDNQAAGGPTWGRSQLDNQAAGGPTWGRSQLDNQAAGGPTWGRSQLDNQATGVVAQGHSQLDNQAAGVTVIWSPSQLENRGSGVAARGPSQLENASASRRSRSFSQLASRVSGMLAQAPSCAEQSVAQESPESDPCLESRLSSERTGSSPCLENQALDGGGREAPLQGPPEAPVTAPADEQPGGTLWAFVERELEALLAKLRLLRTGRPAPPDEDTPRPPTPERPPAQGPERPSTPAEQRPSPAAEEATGPQRTALMHFIFCELPRSQSPPRGRGRKRRGAANRGCK